MLPFYYLRFSGNQAGALLQGQITNNIRLLEQQSSIFTGYCNQKGRLKGLCYVTRLGEDYIAAFPFDAFIAQQCFKSFCKVAPFSGVSVTFLEDFKTVGLDTPSADVLAQAQEYGCAVFPTQTALATTLIAGSHPFLNDLPSMTWEAYQLQSITQKIPYITANTFEQFLPHHLNLPELGAVHFEKGCYIGQEIVARMHYKGHIKRHLRHFQLSSGLNLNPGDTLTLEDNTLLEVVNIEAHGLHFLAIVDDTMKTPCQIQGSMLT